MTALCFACKSRPAGTPGWYAASAFCSVCSLERLDLGQRLPSGARKGHLEKCAGELVTHIRAQGWALTLAGGRQGRVHHLDATTAARKAVSAA